MGRFFVLAVAVCASLSWASSAWGQNEPSSSDVASSGGSAFSQPQQLAPVRIVLHTQLSAEQRAALRESLSWQLRAMDLSPSFGRPSSKRPVHEPDALATFWIQVVDQDWHLYVFDGKNRYVRRLEGANRDAAAVEAAVVIAQRSLTAIADGRAPEMERLTEESPEVVPLDTSPTKPAGPTDSETQPTAAPWLAAFAGYQVSSFAEQGGVNGAPNFGLLAQIYAGLGARVGMLLYSATRVEAEAGVMTLERQGFKAEVGYWWEGRQVLAAGFAGMTLEAWQRSAETSRSNVAVTADTEHLIWAPGAGALIAWVPHRNIAPYVSGGVVVPLDQPTFSSSAGEGATLLTPDKVRFFGGIGLSLRLP